MVLDGLFVTACRRTMADADGPSCRYGLLAALEPACLLCPPGHMTRHATMIRDIGYSHCHSLVEGANVPSRAR